MKKLFIRADSSALIGTGHLKRCLTLVEGLRRYYPEPTFLVNSETRELFPTLANEFLTLDVPFFQTEVEEAEYLLANVSGLKDALVVVDHYQLNASWEKLLSAAGNLIVVIDDLGRRHQANLIIDQNFRSNYQSWYLDSQPQAKLLLGLDYCLINQSYTKDLFLPDYQDRSTRVLINYGGSNVRDLVESSVLACQQKIVDSWEVDLVVGSNLKADQTLKSLIQGANFKYHSSLPTLANLMADSQLAVGAGGTSHWERFFIGLPSVVFTIAENQRQINQDLADAGYIHYLGNGQDYDFSKLPKVLNSLIKQPEAREHLHQRCRKLVDGRGAKRIASEIVALEINLRKVGVEDSDTLFNWRNHLENRSQALNPEEISKEQHFSWYQKMLDNQAVDLFIAEIKQEGFGVLRFDYHETVAKVSIYLDPTKHNSGFGLPLLIAGENFLRNKSKVTLVIASILNANLRSQKIFSDAGYVQQASENGHQIWHLILK